MRYGTECLNLCMLIQYIKLSEAIVHMLHCIVHPVSFNSSFLLLVVRGVPSLILAQSQVSTPLNSRPVIGYRQGRATPIWSPAWSGGYVRCCAWAYA